MPFRLGDLGLRESERSATPTFVGSCNSACILVSHLVETFDVFMLFPGEDCSLAIGGEKGGARGLKPPFGLLRGGLAPPQNDITPKLSFLKTVIKIEIL